MRVVATCDAPDKALAARAENDGGRADVHGQLAKTPEQVRVVGSSVLPKPMPGSTRNVVSVDARSDGGFGRGL